MGKPTVHLFPHLSNYVYVLLHLLKRGDALQSFETAICCIIAMHFSIYFTELAILVCTIPHPIQGWQITQKNMFKPIIYLCGNDNQGKGVLTG